MSFDVFNVKAHILMAAQADAKSRERPAAETLLALQARFAPQELASHKGHYKSPTQMALGHNKSSGPRRQ
jgi:hypothetical protein